MLVVGGVMVMVLTTTFNTISVISWLSVLLVKKTRENHRPAAIQDLQDFIDNTQTHKCVT